MTENECRGLDMGWGDRAGRSDYMGNRDGSGLMEGGKLGGEDEGVKVPLLRQQVKWTASASLSRRRANAELLQLGSMND